MGKKQSSGKHYTSKGIVGVDRKILNAVRRDRPETVNMLNKFKAFLDGRKVYVTIDNPNPLETNKRKIRVLMKTLYGDSKNYRNLRHVLN